MSMLSSRCDRLRDTAMRVEIFLEGSTDAIPMDTHEQLRNAANTIWELRNKLADVVDQSEKVERLEDENARLRSCLSDDAENARQILGENAKLREHLNELLMIGSLNGGCRRDCRYVDDCLADRFGQPDCFVCQELQELGIEV